ncbi:MAG: YidE/YbjL duplication [Leptolyngbyaceae cyanobacterium SM2_5_2]|nr:YidE/YbjL duplication [Leptolyngbyaceae cyanobacterium SM2_5_2]
MLWLWSLLESQPILTLFLVISLGYAIGEISIKGFSLGVGAVLFVGLIIGAFAPGAAPPGILSTVGLVLFFYGIGIQYGKPFVKGLVSPAGQRQNLMAVLSVIGTGLVTAAAIQWFRVPVEIGAGLFTGALVNTAALESVVNEVCNELPVVGYGVAYPFGVFGPILWIFLITRLLNPKIPQPPKRGIQGTELLVTNPAVANRPLADLMQQFPPEVQVVAVRQDGYNHLPRGSLCVSVGDELLVTGRGEPLKQARRLIGEATTVSTIVDVDDLDDLFVYASKPEVVGRRLVELNLAEKLNCSVISIIRGDSELSPHPRLVLEAGDQVHLAAEPGNFEAIQSFFGNSARSTSEVSYLALGLGMVLGVLFGLIPFPLPGLGSFTFGPSGGAMIVSLLLGWRGRWRQLNWVLPPAANLTLRNFGITLFLAVVGLRSAEQFFPTVRDTGFTLLGVGIAITLSVVLVATVLGYSLIRVPFDELMGVLAGVTGNPAILAFASKTVPTNQPELGYAIVFPSSTIIKIIVVQVIVALFRTQG